MTKLNDLIDRLTIFRDKYGCIPVRFNYGLHCGDNVELLHQTSAEDESENAKSIAVCVLNIHDPRDD